ncbi:MAG TPA: hypothetical protein DDX98_08100 [Bacteroidales bacterium]|nr:hypothetical protein [Bacteroidales bacterium]
MIYCGIDPGKKGAISLITDVGAFGVWDMPLHDNGEIDVIELAKILKKRPNIVYIEKAQAMPKQGVSSTFNYGKGYGKVLGLLELLGLPFEEIRPTVWKKAMGLSKMPKAESVKLAGQLFHGADLKTKRGRLLDGRAEALLLAEYCCRYCDPKAFTHTVEHKPIICYR